MRSPVLHRDDSPAAAPPRPPRRLGHWVTAVPCQAWRRPGRPAARPAVAWWALVAAGLSPILMTAAWLIADTLQPTSYSPVRQTVSVLAGLGGTDRWIVTSALFVVGACNLVTAAGLAGVRRPGRVLLIIAGVASIGIATSPEPAGGSTPEHLAWTALGAVTIAVWPAFLARRGPRPLVTSVRATIPVTTVFVALLGWLIIETQGGAALGLAERLTSTIEISWPFIVALALRAAAASAELPAGERAEPGALAAEPAASGTPRRSREERRAIDRRS
ncbi:MAG TPA: DUF998 domain-containing protein [Streptosporangiaceae bacterium]|jgi:hypothetical membrane protein